MKIIEVRDGIIKIDTEGFIANLSSFLKIEGTNKNYIAQVIQTKDNEKTVFAKILFLYENGTISDYDKTSPSEDSEITEFTPEILKNAINWTTPVIAGKTEDELNNIIVDSSIFNKKTLISVDDKNCKNVLIRNLSKQFNNLNEKVIIIDTLGDINAKKYISGKDFKLPLDKKSLQFMYEECLSDVTQDSKSTIVEIFRDLAEYSQTVKFLPFDALRTIVNDMVDKSHIFKLLVLKNKLAKFDKLGYFAKNSNEVSVIDKIINSKCAIVDVSHLDAAFQNKYISYLYENADSNNTRIVLELSNTISKKCLKNILESHINTTFVSHSKFKYINDIKNIFDNFIIFPSSDNNILFNIYSTFLRAMNKNSYLLVGEGTNYIPIVSVLKPISETVQYTPEDDTAVFDEIISEKDEAENILSDDVVNESIEQHEQTNELSVDTNEIIASIDKRSMNTISDITKDIEEPENMEMFSDADETVTSEPAEVISELEVPEKEDEPENIIEVKEEESFSTEDSVISETLPDENIIEAIADGKEEEKDNSLTEIIEDTTEELPGSENVLDHEIDTDKGENTSEIEDTSDIEELHADESDIVTDNIESDETEISIELDDNIDLDLYPDDTSEEKSSTNINEEVNIEDVNNLEAEQDEIEQDLQVSPINDNDIVSSDDEFVELDPDEASENDILIEMEDDLSDSEEALDEEIKREVDKVYTTRKEDDFSETDLDLIDEINNDDDILISDETSNDDNLLEELTEENDNQIIEEYHSETNDIKEEENVQDNEILETRSSSTPIVPVYDAEIPLEDRVESDPVQQGDTVTHVKYGNGIVEKLVKYGNKTLFMINFEMGGRKLLDPMLAEIKKA